MAVSKELVEWFTQRWHLGMGAVDGEDLTFLSDIIDNLRPRAVAEIGVASGFSTACLATLLQESGVGDARVDSFDLETRFYGDRSRPLGYLVDEALPHPDVTVTLHPHSTSLDLAARIADPLDLCFIDACHLHPWPLIDVLAALPRMRTGGVIVLHDLKMYLDSDPGEYAMGPKHVFDQIPDALRIWPDEARGKAAAQQLPCRGVHGNICAFWLPKDRSALIWRLTQAFYTGWDRPAAALIPPPMAARIEEMLRRDYDSWRARDFTVARQRYSGQTEGSAPWQVLPALKRRLRRLTRALPG